MKKKVSLFVALCIFFIITILFSYSNHFFNSFHFDDYTTIVNNIYITDIKNIPLFFKDAQTHSVKPENQKYRPLLSATLAIDHWLGKGFASTFYFHLSTFIWYLLQCFLMYLLYLKIINEARQHEWNKYIALFAVSWYALHPANAETINYIYQRGDSLSTFMVVAAMVLYAYSPRWRSRYIYLVPVIIGMFIKEPTAMFAPILFVYIMLFENRVSARDAFNPNNFIDILKKSLPAFITCILLSIFVFTMRSSTDVPGGTSWPYYLFTQPFVMLHYFITFFLPFKLSADTDWKVLQSVLDIRLVVGVIFISSLLFIAYLTSKKQETRPVSFGILWFFLALIPTSSVIPLADVMNDHRMFFPFVGLTLTVCWSLGLFLMKHENCIHPTFLKVTVIIVASAILSLYAYGTHQRNKVWHTDESLWYDVTIKSPQNGRGLMNYGLTQLLKGRYTRAEHYYKKALELTPDYSYLHINMGILKEAMNQPSEAERYFKNALRYGPNNPQSYFYYALWLSNQDRIQEAIPLLKKTLQISPAHGDALRLLSEIQPRAT